MPAPLPEDLKDKVKFVALQIGVREAARQFEIPEGTVQAWSKRESWFTQHAEEQAIVERSRAMQPAATKPSLSEVYEKFKGKTKLSLCKVVDRTALGLKRLQPKELVNRTNAVLNAVSAYAKLHPDPNSGTSTVNVQLLNQVSVPPAQAKDSA